MFFLILFIYLLMLSAWGSTYCSRVWEQILKLTLRPTLHFIWMSSALLAAVWSVKCDVTQYKQMQILFALTCIPVLNSIHHHYTVLKQAAVHCWFPFNVKPRLSGNLQTLLEGRTHSQVLCVIGIWLYAAKPCAKQGLYIQDIVV